jgi:DNA-binding MarR family transcriptional regulator
MTGDEHTRLAQELAEVLMQMKRLGWHASADQDVRQSERRLLMTLSHADDGRMKVSDLSARMEITPPAVTHIINSLEESSYIERLADPADRRVVVVALTDQGRQMIERLKVRMLERLAGLMAFLGEQDAKELVRLLAAALSYIKKASGEREQNQ